MASYVGDGARRVPGRMLLSLLAFAALPLTLGARSVCAVTDADVSKAMERARDFLIAQQLPSGLWPEEETPGPAAGCGTSETVLAALTYVGEHPNRDCIAKGIDAVIGRQLDLTYAVSMRTMAWVFGVNRMTGERRKHMREALLADVLWLVQAQGSHGGWDYTSLGGGNGRYDLSNTQMAIHALDVAATCGRVEVPEVVWARAQALYARTQRPDGGWNYGDPGHAALGGDAPSYGSMTAAGLASILITSDRLAPPRPVLDCPCRGGRAAGGPEEVGRRVEAAVEWLSREFRADANPKAPPAAADHRLYWLRAAGRAGIAAGRLRFGEHDWYREGAEWLVAHQQADGSWGSLPETCFGLLFLNDGRQPVLFTKLRFQGDWNSHPRDMSRLVAYISLVRCSWGYNWQTADLRWPLAELQEAPILYINVQTPPALADDERRRLRAFTDGGGTILIAASGEEAPARQWLADLAARVWPEWPLRAVDAGHPVYDAYVRLRERPSLMGIDDGLRTFLFYAAGDAPCVWQTCVYSSQQDRFNWQISLLAYATDHAPWRPRLAAQPVEPQRYTTPVTAGERRSLRLVRLKGGGDAWRLGRHYRGLDRVAETLRDRAGVTLAVNDDGVAPADLKDADVAYLAASADTTLVEPERAGVRAYLARGGFLWVEAVKGIEATDAAVRNLARDAGWQVAALANNQPLVTGRFTKAAAYDLSRDVQYGRNLRVERLNQGFAELLGIYQDGRLVGIYSPFDVVFASTGLHAYGLRGYDSPDARDVATNIIVFLTDQPGLK